MSDQHLTIKGTLDAEELAGHRFPYQEDRSLRRGHRPRCAHAGRGPQLARGHPPARGGRQARRLRPLLELVPEDLLRDPGGSRGRDGAQGADEASDRGQLLRDPAQGRSTRSSPSRSSGRGWRVPRPSGPTGSPPRWRAGRSPPGTERGPATDRRHLGGVRRLRRLLRVRVRTAAAGRRRAPGAAAVLRAGRGSRRAARTARRARAGRRPRHRGLEVRPRGAAPEAPAGPASPRRDRAALRARGRGGRPPAARDLPRVPGR